jgi:neutral trehalase
MADATRQRAVKSDFPEINFYDQDLVNLYERSWSWIGDQWHNGTEDNGFSARYFRHPAADRINQFESCFSTFFLVYSNRTYPATSQLDTFYQKQEEDGAIRGEYLVEDGSAVLPKSNPTGVAPPLFSWAEFNLYHKLGAKKRLREVLPVLERHFEWLQTTHRKANGLYSVPAAATMMGNSPRDGCYYPVDFNAQQALNARYLSAIGDVLNDKDTSFKYKRAYFALKTRISQMMWDDATGFYYDLNRQEQRLTVRTIGAFWTLLAEIPNEHKSERLIAHLSDVNEFGVEHPFPTLSAAHEAYSPDGAGYKGSVVPPFNYMVIKGLERYGKHDEAREFALRHLYYVLDGLHPEDNVTGSLYEAYAPQQEGPAKWPRRSDFPRRLLMAYCAISTVAMMIENVVGLYISLPRKTVDWRIPVMEIMGIENLQLKRNLISIVSAKSSRGWEIRLESEKLYYLTINVLREGRRKTLPIPSGKCSILIDKI